MIKRLSLMLDRFRLWLVYPAITSSTVQHDSLANEIRHDLARELLKMRESIDSVSKTQWPVEGGGLDEISEGDRQEMIHNGRAMAQHQIARRDKRIRDLEATVQRFQKDLEFVRLQGARSNNALASEVAVNQRLTRENKELRLRIDELEKSKKDWKFRSAKSEADVGTAKPGRKSPRKASSKGNAAAGRKKINRRKL